MTDETRKIRLIRELSEAGTDILGYTVWWNIRDVRISREEFQSMLINVGLDEKKAKDHNYRSAFKRALKEMEQNRIIRLVDDLDDRLVYQFTAERKVNGDGNPTLEYDRETTVVIVKATAGTNFASSIQAREDIRERLIELYHENKTLYKSSDITRFLQRTLSTQADIISLRQQGSIYFVPAYYQDILDKVTQLVRGLGGACSLDRMPIPNVGDSRQTIKSAFVTEIDAIGEALDEQIEQVQSGNKDITERWIQHRIREVKKIRTRIQLYADVLIDKESEMLDHFSNLEERIIGVRNLCL